MARAKSTRIAEVSVKVGGADLPAKAYADLLDVSVHDDTVKASMFTLRLSSWDRRALAISWGDDGLFDVGNEVAIELGYVDDLAPMMTGEITSLELDFDAGSLPILTVRGYDRSHRMSRGQRTRAFTQVSDSDIASRIAREAGLRADVVSTGVTIEYVMQNNVTDLEFLRGRAEAIGYEVVVEGKVLHFRPHEERSAGSLALSIDQDLIEFHPRLTAAGQVGAVEVRGWDPRTKKTILGKAASAGLTTMGSTVGPKVADSAFGAATVVRADRPVLTQAEADKLASGLLDNLAREFITGDGTCFGRADLRAGIVVDVGGAGERFGGAYSVTSSAHTYDPKKGYRTGFSVARNATR